MCGTTAFTRTILLQQGDVWEYVCVAPQLSKIYYSKTVYITSRQHVSYMIQMYPYYVKEKRIPIYMHVLDIITTFHKMRDTTGFTNTLLQ